MIDERQTVLVIEEEIIIRVAIAGDFQDGGFNGLEAGNSGEALAHLARDASIRALRTQYGVVSK
ncbi:response regulator [Rhizobium ruizarguesonis]|uniref:hypothetical protein n=1 Tax=Rhizobium ruizarguesonis TaxID=2081791 RepID=UPI00103276B6|nr:hypothetical protein [Rhizobium ruizarguesonis]TAT96078.1 hypothetical protein ELI55_26505 [Rhizobium ruizarguesonis]